MKTSDLGVSAMYRILKKAGADRVSDESADELRRVIEDIATDIAKNAVDMSKHAGRKTVKAEDVKLASKTSGKISVKSLIVNISFFYCGDVADRLCVSLQSLSKGVRLPSSPFYFYLSCHPRM